MSARPLPEEITSYDLIKTFAVAIMVIDHLGYYFFPGDMWWRAVGRTGFPVWFFLVGYSTGRNVPRSLAVGALILLAATYVLGLTMFPLNALVSIILIRLTLNPLMAFALVSRARLWIISVALAALALPSYVLIEYGTLSFITAMFGYFVRHRERIDDDRLAIRFMLFALLVFVFYQQYIFEFSPAQFVVMAAGTAAVRYVLLHFKAVKYPALTARCHWLPAGAIRLCGRRTLEIYVVHLLIFNLVSIGLGLPGYAWFRWQSGLQIPWP